MGNKTKYKCLFCFKSFVPQPGTCTVNFHHFGKLFPHPSKNEYLAGFQQGYAHVSCLQPFLDRGLENADHCAVCEKRISKSQFSRASTLTIYIYRKRGCAGVINMHDRCIRKVRCREFFFIKFPWAG
jgi:hypothetical protein